MAESIAPRGDRENVCPIVPTRGGRKEKQRLPYCSEWDRSEELDLSCYSEEEGEKRQVYPIAPWGYGEKSQVYPIVPRGQGRRARSTIMLRRGRREVIYSIAPKG